MAVFRITAVITIAYVTLHEGLRYILKAIWIPFEGNLENSG